ncbi:9c4d46b8-6448-429b-a228-bfa84c96443a [Sclerotinia trifoliorum]|uniref:9c4d46b8-6448-429b-a228-bfa84c96443a n=1 Tax=Sclerotinia trifoliorum TaxID=28548 RepID=A0A8H2VNP6_9HELO|nr:9c4d46b8-6448-429b-a228-bfa84c96443a [Sclerotinia trifoliorum]
MDNITVNKQRPSGLPRPSRLPRPSASRENLQQQPARPTSSIVNPRLRSTASRDQLSASTPSRQRITAPATSRLPPRAIQHKPSGNSFRKPQTVGEELYRPASSEEEDVKAQRFSPVISDDDEGRSGSSSSRPSLSERTMETLQHIPPSPAVRRRQSNFFNPQLPQRSVSRASSSSRPESSYQNDGSMRPPSRRSASSRPTSSEDSGPRILDFRSSSGTFRPPPTNYQASTPMKRPSPAKTLKTPTVRSSFSPGSIAQLPSPGNALQRSPSPIKPEKLPTIKSGSKTFSARSVKERASMTGLFRKPSMPLMDQAFETDSIGFVTRQKSMNFKDIPFKSVTSAPSEDAIKMSTATDSIGSVNRNRSINFKNIPHRSVTSTPSEAGLGSDRTDESTAPKSSSSLRDQIAKAKAAKRAAANTSAASNHEETPVIPTATFDFGLSDDPFNQKVDPNASKGLLRKRIAAARTDGRLNIAAMGFKEIPEEVMNMYNLEALGDQGGSWAEAVDLTRFIAADNEFEKLDENIFPDIDPREAMEDDEFTGNQFGGLETLDLHGNFLKEIPMGLRRLEHLTSLNLSNNKLGNECLQVITQITCLRDLKMAGNGLCGTLSPDIENLKSLEVLEIQRNALDTFPDSLSQLDRLRVLNITENRFRSLPFDILSRLPLIELIAVKNGLVGTLVTGAVEKLSQLQVLDVTSNAITSLSESELDLPSLHQLSCSANRITSLPDLTSWVSLRTLTAEDNNLSELPAGFVELPKVKNVNFSGNNIKILDDRIGRMESLDILRVSGNPLREKKFSAMSTEDLKNALRARIASAEPEKDEFLSEPSTPSTSSRPTSSHWPVKAGGILDRSSTSSHSLNPVIAAEVAAHDTIKVLHLQHNKFKEIPTSIAFFASTLTSLCIAHNELTSDTFLKDDLDLPALKELNLSSNTFNSLQPLIQHLQAPNLEKLDISFNRLTSLPVLKPHFPSLIFLMASHNTIRELMPEAVQGLRLLDCSSNEINSLNSRIGLLGGPNGLQTLEVSGNRFRVPKYTILEKGTEATLAWLRDRIPSAEISGEETNSTDVD